MIIRNKKDISHVDILERIIARQDREKYTYIILGKNGPTGKTWLWKRLRENGLNAIEVTEYLLGIVNIDRDNKHNYFITDDYYNIVVIVLNSPILCVGKTYNNTYI